jgi:hypothetical protein
MKKLIILFIVIFTSCEKKEDKTFTNFVFSSAGLHYDYSLKFTNSDTVYFQKRFPQPEENYYSLLNKEDRKNLNKFVEKIDFEKIDTIYAQENLADGESLLFNISQQKENRWVFIYGHNAPKELFEFSIWLKEFKEKQKFKSNTKIIDFGDLKYILPPPPPPPKVDTIIYKNNSR